MKFIHPVNANALVGQEAKQFEILEGIIIDFAGRGYRL